MAIGDWLNLSDTPHQSLLEWRDRRNRLPKDDQSCLGSMGRSLGKAPETPPETFCTFCGHLVEIATTIVYAAGLTA